MVFETERLVVREYRPGDAVFVLDMYSRWDVQRFLGPAPKPLETLEDALEAIERWQNVGHPDPLLGVWAVTTRDADTPIGTVMLKFAPLSATTKPLPRSGDYEIGWHLHPDHWGRGYATEASAATLRRAFAGGVDEVIAIIHPEDEQSKLVAQRLGMEYVGRTERYYSFSADLFRAEAAT